VADSSVQRFYRWHAHVYDKTRWTILHGRRPAAAALGLKPDSRVLEVGCGTGLNFPYLLRHLDAERGRLVGLDFSADMLDRARRRVARRGWNNVELVCADASKMELSEKFDAIFFAYSLTMIPDWRAALDRAQAHLRPGGTLVVLDFSRFRRWGPLSAVMRAWLRANHVETVRPYEEEIRRRFECVDVRYWAGGYNFTAVARNGTGVHDMPVDESRDILESLVFRGIVFNMSWEDPEMDRQAFRLTPRDTVISISSAGCNPLNFLCQSPKRLISIDGNPAQNAILELKLAGIRTLDHGTFFDIFAARRPAAVLDVYRRDLRPLLSPRSQGFWDQNLWMAARGIYNFGRMGLFCRIMRRFLAMLDIKQNRIDEFFELESLEAQVDWYRRYAAPRLWGPWSRRFVSFKPFMYLAGVHPEQFRLVDGRHDMYEYVKERVEYAFTQVPIYDNYFLSLVVTGRFRDNRVPPYLLEENFETLRANADRVEIVNGWLGPYLDTQPAGSITKFNLLDIFDWMTPEMFEATLMSCLRAASIGATMIYRSGSYQFDPPASILAHVERNDALAARLFAQDRSATYGSFYILTVKSKPAGMEQPSAPAPALAATS
jgi:S-adenosylmethionine-diacylglycerol 3-amino-3-carboxypropyl transferase